jgi:DNA-binding transcriptional ArsR family regulator
MPVAIMPKGEECVPPMRKSSRARAQHAPTSQAFRLAAASLNTMSDPVRLQILWWLDRGDRSVTELCERVGMRQQAVSHHLSLMKLCNVVAYRREGRWNVYYLTDSGREAIAAARPLMRPR